MLDFTSALYLGLQHPGRSIAPWPALTLGRPAALQEPPGAAALAQQLATLQGCQAATLLPSTLHLFWDLFGVLHTPDTVICIEAGTYAVARWGAERGAALGMPLLRFDSAGGLAQLLAGPAAGRRPLIVCDGWRPGSDAQPALAQYAALAAQHGGHLVLDDTQALGVLGRGASALAPLGCGGGGSLQRHGLAGPHLIVGASLAKAFGVPMAVLSASNAVLQKFQARSETRVHSSPPSQAVIAAASHALALNQRCGDRLRQRLLQRVRQFRSALARLRWRAAGGDFPVQSLRPGPGSAGIDLAALHAALWQHKVRTVLHGQGQPARAGLSFVFTAAHSSGCIARAVDVLAHALRMLAGHSSAPAFSWTPFQEAR